MTRPAQTPTCDTAAEALIRLAAYVCDRLTALETSDISGGGDLLLLAEVRTIWYMIRREMDTAVGDTDSTDG